MPIRFGLAFWLIVAITQPLSAADWPHWRGPSRNGLVPNLSGWNGTEWGLGKPLWTTKVGEGSSSPLVVGPNVYLLGHEQGEDVLRCLTIADGKPVWEVRHKSPKYGRFHEGDEGLYSGPSSTPEYDPESKLIYTLSADGDLRCLDTTGRGKLLWQKNLYVDFQVGKRPKLTRAPLRDYGYTTSPIVVGGWLVVEVGSTKHGSVIAFDKKTGEQRWASELKDEAGHTGGPTPITVEGVAALAVITQRHLAVIRIDDKNAGKTIATFPWVTDFANTIAGPAVLGDSVLITAAYNQYALARVQFSLAGAKELWRVKYPSKVCTPVIHEGRVYVSWQKMRCLDWADGKLLWEGGSFGDPGSCIVTKDERVIVYGGKGKLALIEGATRSPTKYVELEKRDLGMQAESWPHVVVSEQYLVCRDRLGQVVCLPLPK